MLISSLEQALLLIGVPAVVLIATVVLPAVFARSRERRQDAFRVLRLILSTLRRPR